ncbi:MAG: hypothetical protein ACFFA6_13355 [Promethearchaeota archaeon]
MSNILDLVRHYPWLPSLKNYYSNRESKDPAEAIKEFFAKDSNHSLQDRILILFKASFENLEKASIYKVDETNIHLYLTLRMLLKVLNDKSISYRVANLYSKITYNELEIENKSNLYLICKDLNLDIKYEHEPTVFRKIAIKDQVETLQTNFRIHFSDYLKLSSRLKDDFRKLINNPLKDGYVYIRPKNLSRLMQEYVRMKILEFEGDNENINKLKEDLLKIQEFKGLYDSIIADWELKKEKFEYSFEAAFKKGEDISRNFPPCMNEILLKAEIGQNLQHTERLIIVFFLLALNYPKEFIINIFSKQPDYDDKKTTYQVDFAKKKGYVPHACLTIKSLNLCMAQKHNDKLCLDGYISKKNNTQKQISHPLFYVQFKQYQSTKKKKFEKEKVQKNND